MPEVAVSFDMGWQKRSSGRTYDSVSGHGMMIGGKTCKIVNGLVLSKRCSICKKPEDPNVPDIPIKERDHDCPRNFDGTSKAMEAEAALRLCIRAKERKYTVGIIVSDNDSTMRAVLKHSYKELEKAHPQTYIYPRNPKTGAKLADKGELPLDILPPTFYADPTHQTKIVAKRFFELKTKGQKASSIHSADCYKMKKYFGYFLKQHCHEDQCSFAFAANAPLEHLFNNHFYCGDWCRRKRQLGILLPLNLGHKPNEKEEKEVSEQAAYFRCKTKVKKLYLKMKDIYDPFTTPKTWNNVATALPLNPMKPSTHLLLLLHQRIRPMAPPCPSPTKLQLL